MSLNATGQILVLLFLGVAATSCAAGPVECPAAIDDEHETTREYAIYHTLALFDENVANAEVAAGADGMALEVADYIVRADDVRRPDVDLCCRVLVREDELLHGLSVADGGEPPVGLYVAWIGALLTGTDPTTPVAYSVDVLTQLERTHQCGETQMYDGFESVEELFRFVNEVPAVVNLSGSSYEAMLNPPVEPYEGP